MKAPWIMLGSAFTVVVLLASAFQIVVFGVPWLGESVSESESDTYTEAIDKVVIQAESSDFLIRGSGRSDVLVSRELKWHADRPRSVESVAAGVLTITPIDCEGLGTCEIDYTIDVPADTEVEVQVNSGDIETLGLTLLQTLRSSSGDIEARNSSGELDVTSNSGDIKVLADEPGRISASASSGDIEILLPQGEYDVTAGAGSGDVTLDVLRDSEARYRVSASTNSGDITIEYG